MAGKKQKPERHEVLITLTSKQWSAGEHSDPIKLTTVGTLQFLPEDQAWVIRYDESEATGMEGTRTKITLNADGSIQLDREGRVEMSMFFQKGKSHISQLDTLYGLFNFSISTNEASGEMTEQGGQIHLGYSLDFNNRDAISTRLDLNVRRNSGDWLTDPPS